MNSQSHSKISYIFDNEHPRVLFFIGIFWYILWIASTEVGSLYLSGLFFLPVLILLLASRIRSWWWIVFCICMFGIWHIQSGYEHSLREAELRDIYTHGIFHTKQYIKWTVDKKMYGSDFSDTYRVSIDNVWHMSDKWILVEVPKNLTILPGDQIGFTGKIQSPSPTQDWWWNRYLYYHRIYGNIYVPTFYRIQKQEENIFQKIQKQSEKYIFQWFPHNISGIILGMTLWNIELLSSEVKKAFNTSGISHILVVSGSNITFLIILLSGVLKYFPIGRIFRVGIISGFIIIYSTIVWWEVAVMRATLMGIIGFIALEYSQKVSSLALISTIWSIFLLFSPLSLLYDAGFGLSFCATLGIILYAKKLQKIWERVFPSWISTIFWVTLAASFGSMPIMLYYFGTFSPSSLLVNILIAPVLWWILCMSVIYLLLAYMGWYILYGVGLLIYIPTKYILILGNFFALGGTWTIEDPWKSIIIYTCLSWIVFDVILSVKKESP